MLIRKGFLYIMAVLCSTSICSALTNTVSITSLDNHGNLAWTNSTSAAFTAPLSNAVYQVLTTTNLLKPWSVLAGFESVPATNLLVTTQIPTNNGPVRFYRIALLTPVLADSIADFSRTQGSNNWFYGYYDGTSPTPYTTGDFKQMTNFITGTPGGNGDAWFVDPNTVWTELWANGGHPNGTYTSGERNQVVQWSVRRWVSPIAGTIHIQGALIDLSPGAGNGVIGHCIIDGTEVNSHTIDDGGQARFAFDAQVQVGSFLDLAIDPRDGWDWADGTAFYVTISQ
jgi:hypothetical protein